MRSMVEGFSTMRQYPSTTFQAVPLPIRDGEESVQRLATPHRLCIPPALPLKAPACIGA